MRNGNVRGSPVFMGLLFCCNNIGGDGEVKKYVKYSRNSEKNVFQILLCDTCVFKLNI